MILFRYLLKETAKTQIAVLFILLLIFISQKFVRVLADAVNGNIPADLVMTILWLNLPSLGTLMIPISLFIAVLFAHGRLHAESEMVVMTACGYSPRNVLNATMVLALITAAFAAYITFYISPAANLKERQVIEEAQADAGLATLIEGRFHSAPDGSGVVYVENYSEGYNLSKIFAAHWPKEGEQRPSVLTARTGKVVEKKGAEILTLYDGQRYEGIQGQKDYQITEFDSFSMVLESREVKESRRKVDTIPTAELIGSKDLAEQVELQWRIALPISILILTFIVVPMAVVNPRQGRYAKLFPALLIYLSYFLLLSASRSGIEDKTLPLLSMWLVQGIFLLVGIYLNIKDAPAIAQLFNKTAKTVASSGKGER
ncbi:LPS export ABC transporter permease LptF [Motilimonas sp. 1_MG-2023]|uniref:LPS export ABC transporter permease LptF n=1 Tax=Motilimonas TaxID=1914248 RepID=UPI001E592783|nr:LPS export ABC transporter permease LptF [Motilimonas sp. 1_MG-2023]MCE0558200.1 LPS export ABC transporter permease LptF [Motilimonas sp. E26]MDO6526380.1 LPS export ABC transporter permease LptF [Motilimonas sp. 1_MG-2023]